MSETPNKEFAERLSIALDLRKYPSHGRGRINYVQEIFGISRSGANKWLHGRTIPHPKKREEIASKLNINLRWLETGEGSPLEMDDSKFSPDNLVHSVPLLTMSEAYHYKEENKNSATNTLIVSNTMPKNCIAITMVGLAMEPKFSENCILLADLDAPIIDGDYVIAKIKTFPEAIIRQYIRGAESNYLVAINSKFEPIKIGSGDCIIGKIIEMRTAL